MAGGAQGVPGLSRPPRLVLASASPRRRQLLEQAGLLDRVEVADVDETPRPGESALACCERLARDKALAVAREARGGVVLGGDTVVIVDGDLLGKPADPGEARAMLGRLSGREHEVASAVALVDAASGTLVSDVAVSRVRFAELTPDVLQAYLDGDEWRGKAGAYAIQGDAGAFARLVQGDLDTVIGLPVRLVHELCARLPQGDAP